MYSSTDNLPLTPSGVRVQIDDGSNKYFRKGVIVMKLFISNVLIAVLLATSLLVVPINSKAEGNDDNIFADFNNATSAEDVLTQDNLTSSGVPSSQLTLVTEGADSGKGMKVALDNDSKRFAQNFSISTLISAFKNASNYSYLRLWINNPDSEENCEIGIRITLVSNNSAAFITSDTAVLTRCDGTVMETKTAMHDSVEGNYHIVVPANFAGWVAWPLNSELAVDPDYNVSTTTRLIMDVRPRGGASSTAYILDEIGLTKDPAGTLRSDANAPLLDFKKQMLEENINSYLNVTPTVKEYGQYNPDSDPNSEVNDWKNIKAITYEGASIDDQKTKVFAYIGFPENASETNQVPAVVLVHGGGGHAYAEWVQKWVDRGYAAIAMDNTGYFPSDTGKGIAGRESDDSEYWTYGLTGDFAEDDYINAPNNDAMQSANGPIQKQWMYHAVVQTILANNILRNDSRIDSTKIGITGISWGGNITSIAMGYDDRYAFAVPVYGAGYLDQSLSYMNEFFSKPEVKALWSAADRFDKVKCPVLWFGWANDPSFSVQSNSLSYLATKNSESILSMYQEFGHSHSWGWCAGEIYNFVDSVVKNGETLLSLGELTGNTRNINFTFSNSNSEATVTAKAYYLTEKMSYSLNGTLKDNYTCTTIDQEWKNVELTVNMGNSTVSGKLPSEAHSYYVEVTSTTGVVTTEYVELGKCGDVNSDACVDILDLVRLKKMLSASSEQEDVDCNADMNSNGKLDAEDLTELRKALLFAK